jgi:hypothetical protein
MRNAYTVLIGKPEGKGPLLRSKRKCEKITKSKEKLFRYTTQAQGEEEV